MVATTPVSSLRYAELTDSPNANTLAQNLATDLDHVVVPKYADTATRDIKNPTPTEGDTAYVSAAGVTKGYYMYSGSGWVGPSMFNQAWTTYTPTWGTSSGAHIPVVGNTVFAFKYLRIGSLCHVQFAITMGTTTGFNSGGAADNWQFSLPYAAVTTGWMGYCTAVSSASSTWPCQVMITATQSIFTVQLQGQGVTTAGATAVASNGGVVDAVTPFTWTSTSANQLKGQFVYEV